MHYKSSQNIRIDCASSSTKFTASEEVKGLDVGVGFEVEAPVGSYILVPACAYDGNRFEGVRRRYPPMFEECEFGLRVPVRMTEVPRLSAVGDSFMDVTTGDMSVPCVGVFNPVRGEAFLAFFGQGSHELNFGVSVEQHGDVLEIMVSAPAKRRLVYRWYDGYPSLRENPEADPPLALAAGDSVTIEHRVFMEKCASISELYRLFFEKRALLFQAEPHNSFPFSAFWAEAEAQFNATHFIDAATATPTDSPTPVPGFYALNAQDGRDTSKFGQWQSGWVGGGMTSFPLMVEGSALSRARAISTLRFAAHYQSEFGLFYGIVHNGQVYGDCFEHHGNKHNLLLIRKHADLTYFMFKQLIALRGLSCDPAIYAEILASARRAADALVHIWRQYGQLGQFVNAETGAIIVGGSSAGGIAPAALCAAALVTGADSYADCAREIARFYYDNAIARGVTTGGPGEILQAPDSESCAGLFESYITLYDRDGSTEWLRMAEETAWQLASWIVPYDYEFPAHSRFHELGIHAAGSVWANVQNKHSAPGICTLSPAGFFKLYRATGNPDYLEVMRQVAHFMPQVASRAAQPMRTVPGFELLPGEICERVNLSDWEGRENVGDSIFGASSWPEASLMLTWLEIPGVYAIPERGIVCASDHVNAWLQCGKLVIQNPTQYDARVKVMCETSAQAQERLGLYWQPRMHIVNVGAGAKLELSLD